MIRLLTILLYGLLLTGLAGWAKTANLKPPTFYVDKQACPFECCTYNKKWRVTQDTPLYNAINGKTIVGTAKAKQKVRALTGEVHTIPTIIQFSEAVTDSNGLNYAKSSKAYVLTYLGEGFYKVWYQGKVVEDERLYCVMNTDTYACKDPLPATVIKRGKSTWWVHVKLKNGQSGWTKQTENFTDNDACG